MQAQNTITIDNPPIAVSPDEQVNVTVNYTNTEAANVYVLVRFRSPSGQNLNQAFTQVPPGTGSETFQIQAPSTVGGGYEYQAQMLELVTWAGLAQDIYDNVTILDNDTGCPEDYTFGSNGGLIGTVNGAILYETNGELESTQTISSGSTVDYKSAMNISLLPSFEVFSGAQLHAYIEGCDPTIPLDRREALLARTQPNGMLSRTGWGMNATGGSNYVTVQTAAEFISAAEAGGNYVIVHESLSNTTITVDRLRFGENTTIDGEDAPGFTLTRSGPGLIMRILHDNIILHCFAITGDGDSQTTGLQCRNGRNVWVNQISFLGVVSDDGMSIGGGNSTQFASRFTVSNCYWDENCFSSVAGYFEPQHVASDDAGYVTVHSCWIQAGQRVMKSDAGRNLHIFNCIIDGVLYSKIDMRNNYDDSNGTLAAYGMQILSEGNVAINMQNANNKRIHRIQTSAIGPARIYTNDNLYLDGAIAEDPATAEYIMDVNETSNPNYGTGPDIPGYNYTLLPTSQVESIVKANAGAKE